MQPVDPVLLQELLDGLGMLLHSGCLAALLLNHRAYNKAGAECGHAIILHGDSMTCVHTACRSVPADVKAEASRAARALLAGCTRQPPHMAAQLHGVLSQAPGPLPLLPGDASALLHTLATGEAAGAAAGMCVATPGLRHILM